MKNGRTELSEKYLALSERHEKLLELMEEALPLLEYGARWRKFENDGPEAALLLDGVRKALRQERGYNGN